MKTDDLKIQLCIAIPFDRPTRNGVAFTREAVEKAVEDFQSSIPIVLRDEDGMKSNFCVGNTIGETSFILWSDESKVCEIITDGVIYHGGADFIVKEIKDGVITDFRITSISISE